MSIGNSPEDGLRAEVERLRAERDGVTRDWARDRAALTRFRAVLAETPENEGAVSSAIIEIVGAEDCDAIAVALLAALRARAGMEPLTDSSERPEEK